MKKNIIILFAIAALTLSSCNKENVTANKLEGKWMQTKNEYNGVEKPLADPSDYNNPEDYKSYIVFADVEKESGNLTLQISKTEIDPVNFKLNVVNGFDVSFNIPFAVTNDGKSIDLTIGTSVTTADIEIKGKTLTLTNTYGSDVERATFTKQ